MVKRSSQQKPAKKDKTAHPNWFAQDVIHVIPIMFHITDTHHRIQFISSAFLKYNRKIGLLSGSPIGKTLFEVFPFLPKKVFDEYGQMLRNKKCIIRKEHLRIKGREYFIETERMPIVKKGQILGFVTIVNDITKQRQIENELRESEQKFRNVVENIGIGVSVISPEMEILTLNAQMKKWFPKVNVAKRPLCYEGFNVPPRKHICSFCPTHKTLKDGKVHEAISDTPTAKGMRHYRVVSSAIKDEKGSVIAAIELVEDITKQVHAENELRREKAHAEQLYNVTPSAIFTVGLDKKVQSWNRRAHEITGYSASEVVGKKCTYFTYYPCKEECALLNDKIKKPIYGKECIIKRKDGELLTIAKNVDVYRDENGTVIGGIESFEDITFRKKAEEKLLLFKNLLDQSNDSVFIINPSTAEFYDVNKEACRSLGYSRDELLKKRVMDVTPRMIPSLKALKSLRKQMLNQPSMIIEGIHTRKNRTEFPVENNVSYTVLDKEYMIAIVRDITFRKESEKALIDSEIRYKTLFNSSRDAIMTLTPEKGFLSGNQSTIEIFSCKDEKEFTKQHPSTLSSEYQPDGQLSSIKAQKMMSIALKKGSHFFEWTHKRLNGKEFYATVLLTRMDYKEKGMLQATVRDISEEKEAQKAVRESELRFRTLFDSAVEGILIANAKTHKFIAANKMICTMLGYSAAELSKMKVTDIHSKVDGPYMLEQFEKLSTGEINIARNLLVLKKNKKTFYADVTGAVMSILNNEYMVGFFRDITEQKEAEDALRDSEERFRALFDCAGEGIVVADMASKKHIDVNQAMCSMTGYAKNELLKTSVKDLHPKKDLPYVINQFEKMVRSETTSAPNVPVKRKNGTVFYADVTGTVVNIGTHDYLVGFFRDVTERLELEKKDKQLIETVTAAKVAKLKAKELYKAYRKVKETQDQLIETKKVAALGQLGAGVAHELNSPLTGVLGLLRAYMNEKNKGSEEYKDLKLMENACEHMSQIIRDLNAFVRQSKGAQSKVDCNKIIDTTLSFSSHQLQIKGIKIKKQYCKSMPRVQGDTSKLQQVVLNIINNACDAMSERSIFTICTRVIVEGKRKYIELVFSDTGSGIKKESLDKIFDPFFTTKRPGKGVGLGLSVTNTIVKNHGGTITVKSNVGKGTVFIVRLPALN